MGVYAEKRKEKNKTKKPHASACVSLNPEACNPPLTKYFFRGVWGGGGGNNHCWAREAGEPGGDSNKQMGVRTSPLQGA